MKNSYYPKKIVLNRFSEKSIEKLMAMMDRNNGYDWKKWFLRGIAAVCLSIIILPMIIIVHNDPLKGLIIATISAVMVTLIILQGLIWLKRQREHDIAWNLFVADMTVFYVKFGLNEKDDYDSICQKIRTQMEKLAVAGDKKTFRTHYDAASPFVGGAVSYSSFNWKN